MQNAKLYLSADEAKVQLYSILMCDNKGYKMHYGEGIDK
jgi:hypothetical protein